MPKRILLVGLGLLAGFLLARMLPAHTVTPERVTGTVTWSNDDTRTILFDAEGPDPTDSRQYSVVGAYWVDAAGAEILGDFPSCLTGRADDPVRTDPRRVELGVVLPEGSSHLPQIAVAVRCLDR